MPTDGPVPNLRFPEFRDAGPWEVKRLGDIANVVRGGSPRPISAYLTEDPTGLNWLQIGDLSDGGKYVLSTGQKIKQSGLPSTREVAPGNLILSNSMSFGRPYIAQIPVCVHDGWLVIDNDKNASLSEFLYYLLLSESSQKYMRDAAAGGGVRNLNADLVKLLPAPLPSLPEQQKIADCLSSLDDLIRAEGARLGALKDHKRALMQRLFPRPGETTPRLRFPDFRDAGPWEVRRLGDFVDQKSGNSSLIKGKLHAEPSADRYPGYSASGQDVWLDTYNYSREAIIVSAVGARCGRCFRAEGQWSAIANTHILFPDLAKIDLDFLYEIVTRDGFWIISGSGQPFVKVRDSLEQNVGLPSLPEQQKIADCLTALDDLIRAQGERIEALRSHKRGLMQQLFPLDFG